MKLLAIDTTTTLASVSLSVEGNIFSLEQPGTLKHAQTLLPMIEELLSNAEITLKDLDAIAFGRGPGSFTGLRVACSIAKGLAYAHDLPLYPVSSLATIAYQTFHQEQTDENVLVLMDARMNELYWGVFSKDQYQVEEQVTPPSNILVDNSSLYSSAKSIAIAGIGYEEYILQLPISIQKNMTHQYKIYPHATAIIRLVIGNFFSAVSVEHALPSYIRNKVTQERSSG